MAYRFRIVGSEAAANGDVHLDTFVETDRTGSWVQVPNGHFTVVLDGQAVLAITTGPGTTTQRRQALLDLFQAEVESRGVDEADDANTQMKALLPGGNWPVTITL